MRDLGAALQRRRAEGLYRRRRIAGRAPAVETVIDGERLLCFTSNDYLGLAGHPSVVAAFVEAAREWGVGAGAAHLVNGHTRLHHELEEALADFTGRPRALLFSSGYMANLGIASALCRRGDSLMQDRLNHASLLDAARFSGARLLRYAHRDAADLARRLDDARGEKLIVSDAVFSMDGDVAPLAELARLARARDAWLWIDDAHGFGVLGPGGRGSVAAAGLDGAGVPILMATLGKALGVAGAFVAGDEALIETLIQFARTYVYTTAQPPAQAAATLAALALLRDESWRRGRLRALIQRFRAGAAERGLPLMDSETAIQPLPAGDAARASAWSEGLRRRGILVSAIRPPTVPEGGARLRVTLSAAHQEAQVDRLLDALGEVVGCA